MKKMFLALAMVVTLGVATSFANGENVSEYVLNAFKNDFNGAKDVNWTTSVSFYKADFTFNGQKIFAFYTLDGELLGAARYISSLQLPLNLLTELKKNYSSYWISDLFEVSNSEGTRYFITLEKNDGFVTLQSTNGNDWSTFSKKKKA